MIELQYLRSGRSVLGTLTPAALLLGGSLLAGCSADITRFDNPSFAFNDSVTGSVGPSSAGGYGGSNLSHQSPAPDYGRSYTGPVTSTVRASNLPDIPPASDSYRGSPSYSNATGNGPVADAGYGRPSSAYQHSPGQDGGRTIVVQPGDTLYALSRRHGVAVSDLMAANGLTSSQLHPGQRLTVPAGSSLASVGSSLAPSQATERPRRSSEATPAASAGGAENWNGTYTVASGDSLYGIARRHGVTVSEIQRYNNISNPERLSPGTVLKVPGQGAGGPSFAETRPEPHHEPNQRLAALQTDSQTDASPVGESSEPSYQPQAQQSYPAQTRGVRTVSIAPPATSTQSADASNTSATKLRWPARGRIISNFGPRPDGTHNDGVNLAVPMGAEVHAAEDGVVAYAGSELRDYGNLILLRHSNGWVTAYAHNDEISVKRGDKVVRGQVIAKAGMTGQVDQPQLHFELRMGSKPVDPLPYLEAL